jgi:hypothetical protein
MVREAMSAEVENVVDTEVGAAENEVGFMADSAAAKEKMLLSMVDFVVAEVVEVAEESEEDSMMKDEDAADEEEEEVSHLQSFRPQAIRI